MLHIHGGCSQKELNLNLQLIGNLGGKAFWGEKAILQNSLN